MKGHVIMKRKQGFTLLELMIVVVILGVLALVAVPALLNAAEQSKESVMSGNVSAAASTLSSRLAIGAAVDVDALATTLNESSKNPFDPTSDAYQGATCNGTAGLVGIIDNGDGSFTIDGCDATGVVSVTKTIYAPEDADIAL